MMKHCTMKSYSQFILIIFMLILLVQQTEGAALSGSLYGLNLEKLENVVVRAGDEQYISKDGDYRFDLGLGEYTVIAAQFDENKVLIRSSMESINIDEDRNYYLDLILIESFDEEGSLFSVLDELEFSVESKSSSFLIGILFLIIAFVFFVLIAVNRKMEKRIRQSEKKISYVKSETKKEIIKAKIEAKQEAKEEVKKEAEEHIQKEVEKAKLELKAVKNLDKSLREIVEFIVHEGGRTTQTEIRSRFPSSEAKISLMITELEDKRVVRKIRKGRGNIIVLEEKY